ncbi:MAG: hypothetical protein HZC26_03285 [Candidatus Magasanikbacteria bacterium]|nr:hypothetical protein [Candidatus Magasanikbacteria bacterium]
MFFPLKRKKILLIGLGSIFLLGVFVVAGQALAQNADLNFGLKPVAEGTGLGGQDIRITIAKIIRAVLGLLGIIALGVMLYGGFMYMTSAGEEEKILTAKKALTNGVIGLVIILSSLALVQFILNKLGEATGMFDTTTQQACLDDEYALLHPELCQPVEFGDFCTQYPSNQFCCKDDTVFYAKSITPVTDNTGMHNVAVRALFNKNIKLSDAAKVFGINLGGQDISNKFDYEFLGDNKSGSQIGVQANYKDGNETCEDGTPCLNGGEYQVAVANNLESQDGLPITEKTSCGDFPLNAKFKTPDAGDKIKDEITPVLSPIKINGSTEADQALKPGKVYAMETNVTDNSGFGYLNFKINKEIAGGNKEQIFSFYDGPTVKHGSDAPEANPYQFIYPLLTAKNPDQLTHYFLEVEAWDIDSNSAKTKISYVLGEQKGTGDTCSADWECDSSQCSNGVCVAQPKILDVYPLNGAAGNWITIVGNYFGDDEGKIEFAYDDNNDGKVDDTDTWQKAFPVDCEGEDIWTDNWAIIGAPSDKDLPLGSKSAIRLTRFDSTVEQLLIDYTIDNFGPKPGGDGLFEKNNIKRPGLCSVKTVGEGKIPAGATFGPPGAAVKALGDALGTGVNSGLFFGGVIDKQTKQLAGGLQASVASGDWTDKLITAKAPNNMANGKVAVYAKVGAESSNGVPFTIDSSSAEDKIPVIEQIDPESAAPGSLMTISGKGFGYKPGEIYLASSLSEVKSCAKNNGGAGCVQLNTTLPGECGINWTPTQVIAQVPLDAGIKNYQLILENEWEVASDGQEKFSVVFGKPAPGICKIQPNSGPAPLPAGQFLDIYGINFKNPHENYFWQSGASVKDISTWLSGDEAGEVINQEGTHISKAQIPVESGKSMQSGPIKVGVENKISKGVKYTVDNCQTANKTLADAMKASGYQCCSVEGPDAGIWKSSNYICGDEARIGGYVWRFTTGIIPILPQVMEECNEVDWNDPDKIIAFPSPVPSVLWSKGKESCLNATIALKFNVAMNETTLNGDTIKVFKCDGSDNAVDCGKKKEQAPATDFEFQYQQADHVLKIWRQPKAAQPDLDPFTWYQIELSDKIESNNSFQSATGENVKLNEKLQATKPCGVGTAYCFSFRTGNEMCTLKGAGIIPPTYTAHLLGLILDPAYPANSVPTHPLYYFLWGKGSQECIVMPVDGLGWEWGVPAEDEKWASVKKSPSFDYIDSRAEVTAKSDTGPDEAKITASLDKVAIVNEQSDFLALVGKKNGLSVATTTDVISVKALKFDDYILKNNYEIDIKYVLDDVSTSTVGFVLKKEMKAGKQVNVWVMSRYILAKSPFSQVYVLEKQYEDGVKERIFTFTAGSYIVSHKQDYAVGKTGNYQITKTAGELSLTDEKSGVVAAKKKVVIEMEPEDIISFKKANLSLGGYLSAVPPSLLYGTLEKYLVKLMAGDNFNQSITATSTLKISLSDPEVVEWWPNCNEACINSGIGFKFNVEMYKPDYDTKNFLLQECVDETCQTVSSTIVINKADSSGQYIARFSPLPGVFLEPNIWYQVTVKAGVRALGGYGKDLEKNDDDEPGKPMKADFVGKFKTKNDASPCAIDSVEVFPSSFTAWSIGQKQPYTVIPRGKPDQCAPFGQEFNPWGYGWEWGTKNPPVASVTKFKSPASPIEGCNLGCLLTGSDITKDQTPPPLCGNGKVEAGEDCDLVVVWKDSGNQEVPETVGISCTSNCLRPGNKDPDTCGDGKVDWQKGEECDPKKADTINCTKECVWTGAYEGVGSPVCGSGDVKPGVGKDCDINDPNSKIGCSDKCLHTGTNLSKGWCIGNVDKLLGNEELTKACLNTISVCGNSALETGEECEFFPGQDNMMIIRSKQDKSEVINVDNAKKYCSNSCLTLSLCGLKDNQTVKDSGLYCAAGTEGCDTNNCHQTGSSVTYSAPSLCGDGIAGIGEYKSCEVGADALQGKDENPVQLVTAIGKGAVDPISKEQKTEVNANAVSYLNQKSEFVKLNKSVGGSGDYALKCGFKEMLPYVGFKYNDCPKKDSENTSKWGVAENSCCYERSYRIEEYPIDTAGIAVGDKPICRNSYIAVKFNSYIAKDSLPGNLIIAHGHPVDYNCADTGEQDVTSLYIDAALAYDGQPFENGFWQKAWQWFKGLFARLFGTDALALKPKPSSVVWCSGAITAAPEVTYETKITKEGLAFTTSTVSVYLKTLLPENTEIAVILKGGNDGVRDVNGVGVRNPTPKPGGSKLLDKFVFKTGAEICKLKDVTVSPDKYLFTAPATSASFMATAHSTSDQLIVPISPVYNWEWDWQPQENKIFDIPFPKNSGVNTPNISIASTNLEGSLPAVASAKVTEDVSVEDNHVGKMFNGITYLQANFCQNPWPKIDFYPFEDGINYGKDKNQSGFEDGEFGGTALPTPYINYSLSYCADAGKSESEDDNLPYLKPMLNTPWQEVKLEAPSTCQFSPKIIAGSAPVAQLSTDAGAKQVGCSKDSDCPVFYNMPYANSTQVGGFSVDCNTGTFFEVLMKKDCVLYELKNGYCGKENLAPPQYGATYRSCTSATVAQDCQADEVCNDLALMSNLYKVDGNKCIAGQKSSKFEEAVFLEPDIIKQFIFFNEKNDDVIGIKIFKNEKRFSAAQWLEDQNITLIGAQNANIGGYDAVTDGSNFYINSLNIDATGKTYNNIFLLSINKNAQSDTKNVFDQLLKSLKFNINISDFGYCLANSTEMLAAEPLPLGQYKGANTPDTILASITNIKCNTNFDCRNSDGAPKNGSSGVCSNAKTKLFRDYARLPDIKTALERFEDYWKKNGGKYPELKSGTYIPAYTASKWPSWGLLAGKVGGLPLEKINKWSDCPDKNAESQTCWNAASSTFSCPFYSSVYEYTTNATGTDYKLHGPLEYFASDNQIVQEKLDPDDGIAIDTGHFTTERACQPAQVLSPFAAKCGDGLLNLGTETCEPPGKLELSDTGWVKSIINQPGKCQSSQLIGGFKKNDECWVDKECGLKWETVKNETAVSELGTGICVLRDSVLFDFEKSTVPNGLVAFACEKIPNSTKSTCNQLSTYASANKVKHQASPTIYINNHDPLQSGQLYLTGLLNNQYLRCASWGDQDWAKTKDFFKGTQATQQPASSCVGVKLGEFEEVKDCAGASQAYSLCNNKCQLEYTSCESKYECGNGIVEPGETCDDGALNNSYGNCNNTCSGKFSKYCGNNEIDKDANNKNLEFCENASNTYVVYGTGTKRTRLRVDNLSNTEQKDKWLADCKNGNPNGCELSISILSDAIDSLLKQTDSFDYCQYDQTLLCKSNNSCLAPLATYKLDVLTADFSNIDDYFSDKLINKGPCVKSAYFGTPYSKNKNFTCSWDCQNYGEYCGDGLVQSASGEDCDDKDTNNLNACNNACLWVNTTCKEKALFATSTLAINETYVEIQKNPAGTALPVSECFVNSNSGEASNGAEVCRAYGLYCKKVTFETFKGSNIYGDFSDNYCDKSFDGIKNTIYKNNPIRVECGGIYAGPAPVAPVSTAGKNTCGNGIQETYDKNGDTIVEKCDLGAQNGIACAPEYSKSCTYCSADCKEVLTKDSDEFCGNGVIDHKGATNPAGWEQCEIKDNKVINHADLEQKRQDQGSYTCTNDCKLINTCVDCGKKLIENGGAVPKIAFLNPMLGKDQAWPSMVSTISGAEENNYVSLYRDPGSTTTPFIGYTQLTTYQSGTPSKTYSIDAASMHNLFKENAGKNGLETNKLCDGQYNLHFNSKWLMITEGLSAALPESFGNSLDNYWPQIKDYGDLFVYPVNKEKEEIKNEFIYSPAVPENTFRVVVRWSDNEKNTDFMGNVYSSVFYDPPVTPSSFINILTMSPDTCNEISKNALNYWMPTNCQQAGFTFGTGQSVFVHDSVNLEKTYAQAMTIGAQTFVVNGDSHPPFAFFVEAVGDYINSFTSSPDVSVEVYTYHPGQIPDLSVYKPTQVFKINAATKSTNASSQYWHVFNLEYKNGKYEIVPIQKIKTGWCEVQDDIPNEKCVKVS